MLAKGLDSVLMSNDRSACCQAADASRTAVLGTNTIGRLLANIHPLCILKEGGAQYFTNSVKM